MKAVKLSAIALAGVLVAGTGLAVTGALPGGLQDGLADALDGLGIDLPGGSPPARAATPAPVEDAGEGTAFKAPETSAVPERTSSTRRAVYGRDDAYEHYPEYYREYFGFEEDDEDDGYRYVPAPQERYHPGGAGEPGSPARSEGEGEQHGENDGVHGPAGPAGDPG